MTSWMSINSIFISIPLQRTLDVLTRVPVETDVKGRELLVPAWRRTVGQVCIRVSARSSKDSFIFMWLLVCRQNSKPAWLVLKAEEEQRRAASRRRITHDYGLIIGCFLYFFLSIVALIVWVWVYLFIYLLSRSFSNGGGKLSQAFVIFQNNK